MRVIGNASVAAAAQLSVVRPARPPATGTPVGGRSAACRATPEPSARRWRRRRGAGGALAAQPRQGPRRAARGARRAHRAAAGQARDPPAGRPAAGREAARGRRPEEPHPDAAPRLHGQPGHRQDDGRASGRRHLPGAGAAVAGPPGRGRPLRARRRLPRPDRDQDGRRRRVGGGRGAVHRRGVQPDGRWAGGRPVRPGVRRHPGQGDGGPARRPRGHRGRLPGADGGLHRREPRSRQPVPHHDRVRGLHRRRARRDPASTSRRARTTSWSPRPSSGSARCSAAPRGTAASATAASPATPSRRRSATTPGGCARRPSRPSSSFASSWPGTSTRNRSTREPRPPCLRPTQDQHRRTTDTGDRTPDPGGTS